MIKVDSSALLHTIISSHRESRRQALQSYFTTLTMTQIPFIFPMSSSRTLNLLLFWRAKGSGRLGHHYIPDLKFGSTSDLVGSLIELVKDKAGGMYQESQIQQKLLIRQLRNSEYGQYQDPIEVDFRTDQQFIEWDFDQKGPLTVAVRITLKNLSTTWEAQYKLNLLRENPNRTSRSFDSMMMTTNWVGRLNYSGKLKRLERREIECRCWFFGPGMMNIGQWECETSYGFRPDRDTAHDSPSPIWKKSGDPMVVSVAAVPSQLMRSQSQEAVTLDQFWALVNVDLKSPFCLLIDSFNALTPTHECGCDHPLFIFLNRFLPSCIIFSLSPACLRSLSVFVRDIEQCFTLSDFSPPPPNG